MLAPWLYPDGVAAARIARDLGARLWLMALGSDTFHLRSPLRRRMIVDACAQAEGVICVANILADRLAAAGVPRSKLHVVPNGVDTSLFRYRKKEEVLSCQVAGLLAEDQEAVTLGTSHIILFVGNLVPVKGPDVLLKAFSLLTRVSGRETHDASLHLLIIGTGPMQAQLERLAMDLGIADHVHFMGRQSPEAVARWMNRADVLCLSSHSEGMPNVVLEARASGLPVVTTPAGAIPELPLSGEHFLVVKSCSPGDLAEGLQTMLGRDTSVRRSDPAVYTWADMATKVLELMRRGRTAPSPQPSPARGEGVFPLPSPLAGEG